jgi:hypothetical protein
MVRTHVYLTEEQVRDIKVRAQRERRREAEVIRDLIERGRLTTPGRTLQSPAELLARIDRLGLSGPTDLSTNHDDYSYGEAS